MDMKEPLDEIRFCISDMQDWLQKKRHSQSGYGRHPENTATGMETTALG